MSKRFAISVSFVASTFAKGTIRSPDDKVFAAFSYSGVKCLQCPHLKEKNFLRISKNFMKFNFKKRKKPKNIEKSTMEHKIPPKQFYVLPKIYRNYRRSKRKLRFLSKNLKKIKNF